jgi:hypothetical protein
MASASTTPAAPAPASAISTAAAGAAPAAAFCLRFGFVDHQIAPAKILSVQRINGLLGVFVAGHFDEREPAGLACKPIPN